MNNNWRKYLNILSWMYGKITKFRNKLYDNNILKSNEFKTPLIVVGNLRVGGTGKTPMVNYLINLLKPKYSVAVLSRGYKRESRGFVLAAKSDNAQTLGDEPYLLKRQHPEIMVAVDTDRTNGIKKLEHKKSPPKLIILDDAYQHRKVKANLNILLTPYKDLYTEDKMLPAGNLREGQQGAKRAKIIVVTKCPKSLTEQKEFEIAKRLKINLNQTIFFSTIIYAEKVISENNKVSLMALKNYKILLITGIATPEYLVDFLTSKKLQFKHIAFPDHHTFSRAELNNITDTFNGIKSPNKLILTTEKDYVRINGQLKSLYYLPIKTCFLNHKQDFDKMILNYID